MDIFRNSGISFISLNPDFQIPDVKQILNPVRHNLTNNFKSYFVYNTSTNKCGYGTLISERVRYYFTIDKNNVVAPCNDTVSKMSTVFYSCDLFTNVNSLFTKLHLTQENTLELAFINISVPRIPVRVELHINSENDCFKNKFVLISENNNPIVKEQLINVPNENIQIGNYYFVYCKRDNTCGYAQVYRYLQPHQPDEDEDGPLWGVDDVAQDEPDFDDDFVNPYGIDIYSRGGSKKGKKSKKPYRKPIKLKVRFICIIINNEIYPPSELTVNANKCLMYTCNYINTNVLHFNNETNQLLLNNDNIKLKFSIGDPISKKNANQLYLYNSPDNKKYPPDVIHKIKGYIDVDPLIGGKQRRVTRKRRKLRKKTRTRTKR